MDTYNRCVRCGKVRVTVRVWKEDMGGSTITNTETACPDKACQKIVDLDNKKQKDKNTAMRLRSQERHTRRRAKSPASQ